MAEDARARHHRRQHLRLQRLRAGQGRRRRRRKVNPSIPFWGGPTGIDTNGTAAGDRVCTYGNSSLRFGITQLSPHTGISLGDDAADGGWSHPLYTVTPGVPGDSGSAFVSAGGKAIGILSTLGLAPLPPSNNIGDLAKELAFAQANAGIARADAGQRHRAVRPRPLRRSPLRPRPRPVLPGGAAACLDLAAATARNGEAGVAAAQRRTLRRAVETASTQADDEVGHVLVHDMPGSGPDDMDAVGGAPRQLVVIAEPQPPELSAHQVLAEHRNRQVAVAHVGHLFLERVGVDVAPPSFTTKVSSISPGSVNCSRIELSSRISPARSSGYDAA